MNKEKIIIALVFLFVGFTSAYLILGRQPEDTSPADNGYLTASNNEKVINPFISNDSTPANSDRMQVLEKEVSAIKLQLQDVENNIRALTNNSGLNNPGLNNSGLNSSSQKQGQRRNNISRNRYASALSQRLYNLDNLIRGGIEPGMAEDIVRRKNSIELKRLELQDHATRENYLNTDRYFDELEILNQEDVSLREELGDQRYDEYLFNSKQNNRIRISSVMLGSVAEQIGIKKGDVVLSYDDNRMFSWQELKDATAAGELGEYVSISIYRNGEIFSYSVPRGPLGMKLGATRLPPQ